MSSFNSVTEQEGSAIPKRTYSTHRGTGLVPVNPVNALSVTLASAVAAALALGGVGVLCGASSDVYAAQARSGEVVDLEKAIEEAKAKREAEKNAPKGLQKSIYDAQKAQKAFTDRISMFSNFDPKEYIANGGKVNSLEPSDEVDAYGKPIPKYKVEQRNARRKAIGQTLASNGYTREKLEKLHEENYRRYLEANKERIEENRREARENPTNFHIIQPGMTPADAAAQKNGVAMRYIEGKWQPVDKDGRPVLKFSQTEKRGGSNAASPAAPKPASILKITTKVTKRAARSSDVAAVESQTYWKDNPAFTQKPTWNLVESIINNRTVVVRDPSLKSAQLDKLFPDLKKDGTMTLEQVFGAKSSEKTSKTSVTEPEAAPDTVPGKNEGKNPKRNGKPVSFLKGISGLAGRLASIFTPTAFAGDAGNVKSTEPNSVVENKDAAQRILHGARKNLEANGETGSIPNNKYADDFADAVEAIASRGKKLQEKIKNSTDLKKAVDEINGNDHPEAYYEAEQEKSYMEKLMDQNDYDGIASNAEEKTDLILKQTADLIRSAGNAKDKIEQYKEDTDAILDVLHGKKTGEEFLSAMRGILREFPEIYDIEPDADRLIEEVARNHFNMDGAGPVEPKGEQTYVFLSRSLGENALKELFKRAAFDARDDLVFVFRGIKEGQTLEEGYVDLQQLAADVRASSINLVIDPTLFKKYNVKVVPTVVRAKGKINWEDFIGGMDPTPQTGAKRRFYGDEIARVEGLNNDEWLLKQIENGEKGDLGVRGDIQEIDEPDLIEAMQKRFAAVDWEKEKEAAIKRVWYKQNFYFLPTATESRVRHIDPTIEVKEDIKALGNKIVRHKGEKVNPLAVKPYYGALLIFDPLSKNEMRRVGQFLSRNKMQGKVPPKLIATRVDREKGWDSFNEIADTFNQPIFILNKDIVDAFHIEVTPTYVTADNKEHIFVVQEMGPLDNEPEDEKLEEQPGL